MSDKDNEFNTESNLALKDESSLSERVAQLEKANRIFARASYAHNTKRGYASDWNDFLSWCRELHRNPLPADASTVALYITELTNTLKVSSLRRRIIAIKKAHEIAELKSPTTDERIRQLLRGIIRTKGIAQDHAVPTLLKHIQMVVAALPANIKGIRDRAILLIGFAGGLRRSELVGLNVEDLALGEEGIAVHVRKGSKDLLQEERIVGITFGLNPETCPIKALEEWLKVSGDISGRLFAPINRWGKISKDRLTDQSIRLIVKEALKRAGIAESGFSGHSLRAGFATVAAMNGASEREIQRSTGHISLDVLRRYIRDGDLFRLNASRKLGL